MRLGLPVSVVVHAAAVAVGVITWPQAAPAFNPESAVVPIEVVDFSAQSNIAPIAVETPPEALEELAVEGAPQELAEAAPVPDVAIAPEPTPPKQKPKPADQALDLDQLSLLLDKAKNKPGQRPDPSADAARPPEDGERPRRAVGAGDGLSVSEQDAIRAQMRECWRMPIDMAAPETLIVRVRVRFEAQGALIGAPQLVAPRSLAGLDPAARAAAEAALRAVRLCDPLRVNPQRTQGGEVTLNFDPREMISP